MSNKSTAYCSQTTKYHGKSLQKSLPSGPQKVTMSHIPNIFARKKVSIPNYQKHHRVKTQQASIEKLPTYKNSGEAWHTPKSPKSKWIYKDEGLRQTWDSFRQIRKKTKLITVTDFLFLKVLGKGRHGVVHLVAHKQTGFIGALKVFQKQDFHSSSPTEKNQLQELLIRELKIQSFVSHTHILKVYSVFCDEKCVYLFMELGSDGQLFEIFQKQKLLKQRTISFIFRALLEAVHYLHQNHIIHRDLKPQNIVLVHGFPKICDFGQSSVCKKDQGELRQTLCGTPLYLSPQILKGDKYDSKIDIWALGAMAYQLFTGENPFKIKTKEQLKKVVTDQFNMTVGSPQFRSFLTYCLKKNPKERPNGDKLLKHPFIKKWADLQTSQELCSS